MAALALQSPPAAFAARACAPRMASETIGILVLPRLRCLRAMLKCLRLGAARARARRALRCDPRLEERLAERLCRCCQRQRGFDGPHGIPLRAMHTAPGPAGAARGHEKEFSRYLDSTARRSTS